MRARFPNIASVELIAQALGPLRDQLVLVGGCAVDLLLTDSAASPELKRYLVDRCSALFALPNFMDALSGMVFPDESLAERVKMIGLRLKQIAEI